jgi:protein O-mannosyl-transferase
MSKNGSRHSRRKPANLEPPKSGRQAFAGAMPPPGHLVFTGLLLAVITLCVYWPVTAYDFISCDDGSYVTDNVHVRRGLTWEGICWAFGSLHAANWHPLTWLSHMLDVTLFGMQPGAHHLTNMLFHSANTVLLFAWLMRMSGAHWRSAAVAALFALHPLHVESVAWVAERKDVLSTFFGFLALYCYAGYAQKQPQTEIREWGARTTPISHPRTGTMDYALILLFLALGLMSKPMLVTWPFLMLLLDYWPLRRIRPSTAWRLIREKVPFLFLSLLSSVTTVVAQAHGRAVLSLEQRSFAERLENSAVSYLRYLSKTFWPVNLAMPYPFPERWPAGMLVLSLLLIGGLCVAAIWFRRRWPFLPVGWFLFLGLLIPVIGLLQVGSQSMADRYTYVPLVGIFIIVVWGMSEVVDRWHWPKTLVALGTGLALVGCVILTRRQISYWQDSEILFYHTIATTENNAFACYNLGCYLESKGRIDEAMKNYQLAVRFSPDYAKPMNNIGKILSDEGHFDEAIDFLGRALQANPDYPAALNNFGTALAGKRQFADAVGMYVKALRLDPTFVPAYYNLGIALEAQGQWQEAILQYTEVLRLKPDYWEAHNNLGYLLLLHKRANEAAPHFRESLRLNPRQPDAQFNLGNALAIQQNYEEAIVHFYECLKLSPDYAPAHKNLGMALARLGRREEAIRQLQEAIRLKPDYEEAVQQLRALTSPKEE